MGWYEKYKVDVPVGECGDWTVERFTFDRRAADMERTRAMFTFSGGGRGVPEGTYTSLKRRGYLVMSDTPDEIRDHLGPIHEVVHAVKRGEKPTCLVHGLGLGMVAKAMLDEGAAKVTIVEQSSDVIDLVGKHLLHALGGSEEVFEGYEANGSRSWATDRLSIINDDALTWQPLKGAKWDVLWHDIWDDLCTDNLPEMKILHRRFGRRSRWQGSWGRELCERAR